MSNVSTITSSLMRLISLKDPNSLIPPAANNPCNILELPVKVYMPGFTAFPVTKIFTSLISVRLTNASVPINEELTLDLISSEASFKDNPAITNSPISGRLTEPSEFIKSSSIYSFGPTN